jgi:hypothetical protein
MKGGDGIRFKYGRLDGTTPRARRNMTISLFNNDPCKFVRYSPPSKQLPTNVMGIDDEPHPQEALPFRQSHTNHVPSTSKKTVSRTPIAMSTSRHLSYSTCSSRDPRCTMRAMTLGEQSCIPRSGVLCFERMNVIFLGTVEDGGLLVFCFFL